METATSKFLAQVGNDSFHRILEFFLEGRDLDFSIADICEDKDVSRSTVDQIWEERFIKTGLIKKTRKVGGKTQLYALNKEHVVAKLYLQMFDYIVFDIYPSISKSAQTLICTHKSQIRYIADPLNEIDKETMCKPMMVAQPICA